KLVAAGSQVSFLQNGVVRITVTDSSLSGGSPGIMTFGTATADNWAGGDASAGGAQINLSWGAASDNVGVSGYQVFRCQGAGCSNFAQVGTPAGTSFSDTGLSAGTSYSYQVRAVDAAGNQGAFSNTATGTTPANPDTQPPSAPGTLAATAAGSSQVNLSWGAATDKIGGAACRESG